MGYHLLKKNLLGGYKLVEEFSNADLKAWSLEEADQLLEERKKYKELSASYKERAEKYGEEKTSLVAKVKELESLLTAEKEKSGMLQENFEECSRKLLEETAKNGNLLRICRERANSERGLIPKKKHDGYLEQSREQVELTRVIKKSITQYSRTRIVQEKISFFVWKYHFQSPYDVSLTSEIARTMILSDLEKKGLLFDEKFNLYDSKKDVENSLKYDIFFNFSLTVRAKSKFWEIKFMSCKSL